MKDKDSIMDKCESCEREGDLINIRIPIDVLELSDSLKKLLSENEIQYIEDLEIIIDEEGIFSKEHLIEIRVKMVDYIIREGDYFISNINNLVKMFNDDME